MRILLLVLAAGLGGCSLEAAMSTCADCGEVRSITPRVVHNDIRLFTNAPDAFAVSDADAAAALLVFHVRVRMDRGGSRDFMLPQAGLQVGDRVEVRGGALILRDATAALHWS